MVFFGFNHESSEVESIPSLCVCIDIGITRTFFQTANDQRGNISSASGCKETILSSVKSEISKSHYIQ